MLLFSDLPDVIFMTSTIVFLSNKSLLNFLSKYTNFYFK